MIFAKRFIGFALVIVLFGVHWSQTINSRVGPYKVIGLGKLHRRINESSGLAKGRSDSTYFTHNDGNYPEIFEVTLHGKTIRSINLPLEMSDFEEISKDKFGNIYVGDIGNNFSNRRNLTIYRFNETSQTLDRKIEYSYPDQKDYSFWGNSGNFDCEAFFYFNDSLYLFSKNKILSRPVRLYTLPAQTGRYVAKVIDKEVFSSPITAADISPSLTCFALLTYKYLYIYEVNNNEISFKCPRGKYYLGDAGQVEAICFINETDILMSNEGGKLYLLKKILPPKPNTLKNGKKYESISCN